jgi:hypothetical protein
MSDLVANFNDIDRIIVAFGPGIFGDSMRIFPCLSNTVSEATQQQTWTYLRQGTIVPGVAFKGIYVGHKARFMSILGEILFDRVQGSLFVDFKLGIGPSRDFHHHVVDAIGLVMSIEGNVVEWRYNNPLIVFLKGEVEREKVSKVKRERRKKETYRNTL